jgi:hypothetical protein
MEGGPISVAAKAAARQFFLTEAVHLNGDTTGASAFHPLIR